MAELMRVSFAIEFEILTRISLNTRSASAGILLSKSIAPTTASFESDACQFGQIALDFDTHQQRPDVMRQ